MLKGVSAMTIGQILIIAIAVLVVVALVCWWLNKRKPEKTKTADQVLENVVALNDKFNRARYQNVDDN